MADPDSLRKIARSPAPFSTWLGIVLLFVLFGMIVLAIVGPSPRGSDYEETRAKKRMEVLKKLRDDTEKDLTTYAWSNKSKGVARIPISRAMEVTVAELAQKKPAPAGPIATPAAAASPAVTVSPGPTSPAPAGSPKPGAAQPAASPSSAAAGSPSPAAQQSPSEPASPAPTKTP